MKTKWGACNIRVRKIWLNLELTKVAPHLLEYVVVHELTHLLERAHNDHFKRCWKALCCNGAHTGKS
jgi:predicted metal-dependent hydrolase